MVYFIKDTVTQAIKIGYSANPDKRLPELQTGNPHKLILLGTIRGSVDAEAQLHGRFVQYRMEGEWFKGEIIEEVLDIIAADKERRRQIRRKTMTEPSGDGKDRVDVIPTAAPAAVSVDDVGTLDNDSGIRGVCRIPGLKMKRFSLKLTEEQGESRGVHLTCGMEIKYVLEFATKVKKTAPADSYSLGDLQNAIGRSGAGPGLQHTFLDEDSAVIPFSPSPSHCHIVGGVSAITGEQGPPSGSWWPFRRCFTGHKGPSLKTTSPATTSRGSTP